MKEATGELNMTVITVVAIAAVGAFFYAFIWPAIQNSLRTTNYCNSVPNSFCTGTGSNRTCTGYDGDGNGTIDDYETNVVCAVDTNTPA